jgi:RNA polymerase primary sigma factor
MESYFKKLAEKYPVLSSQEQRKLLIQSKEGDKIAREKLILSNIRFAIYACSKYTFYVKKFGLDALISESLLGINHSIDTYNLEYNINFISYAGFWIKQYISKFASSELNTVSVPYRIQGKLNRYRQLLSSGYDEFYAKAYSGLEDSEYLNNITNPSSLERVNGETIDVADEKIDIENKAINNNLVDGIIKRIKTLKEIDRFVIEHRWGINNKPKMTLQEISEILNITKENVRQRQKRIERTLKQDSELKVMFNSLSNKE